MIMAQLVTHLPKFAVMCHVSSGAGNFCMCGRAYDGRFLFTWPNHQIGVMGGEQAANTLAEVKLMQMKRNGLEVNEDVLTEVRNQTLKAYETQTSAYFS